MHRSSLAAAHAAVLCCVLLFTACGGGGGGGGTPAPPAPPPAPPPATFTVGGTLGGLAGNSVALRLNGGADFVVAANGSFTFPGPLASGTAYIVTVQTQPTGPAQTCALANATGNIAANVTNVTVTCTTPGFLVRGTLSGLAGGSVVLRNNGGDDLTLAANGVFQFATAVAGGGAYAVTVQTQPTAPAQVCVVAQGAGNVAAADVTNVTVNCTTNTYRVRGTLSGLAGGSLVLRNSGGDDLTLAANGPFVFAASVPSGGAYSVTVQVQPLGPSQTCVVTQGAGNVAAADVTNVAVNCTINTFAIGGTVAGLNGSGLVLRNNGGNDLAVNANGSFTFSSPVASGSNYLVAVRTQPAAPLQRCTVTNAGGTVLASNITSVAITCVNLYTIGGTVTGLNGSGLVLRNSGGNDLAVNGNGAFTFSSPVVGGTAYLVSVLTQPTAPFQLCTVSNAGGTAQANVTNVAITCVNTYAIGGTVRGLDVAGLVLRNSGGDDLTVSANGSFAFATRVTLGTAYSVATVAGTPAAPRHVCQVVNGAGAVNTNTDVTNVQVNCEADRFAYVAHYSTVSFDGPGLISALTMNHETGALAPIAGASTFVNANGGVFIVSDPRGRFIYVAHMAAYTQAGSVSGFSVNPATGALTPVPGSPYSSGSATGSLAIDSEGNFLYATNTYSNDVSGWRIETDGSLTPVPGSPYRIGDLAQPASVGTSPAGKCCHVYVAHSNMNGVPHVSAYAYHPTTGALTPLPGSPFSAGLSAYTPRSLQVNPSGDLLYVANSGTSNFSTFDISGTGTLTQRAGSPTPAGNSPCDIRQPPLSPALFVASNLSYDVQLYGSDPGTGLPQWLDSKTMFVGSYCSVATDPYGKFVYLPNPGNGANSDYLFGFMTNASSTALLPVQLNSDPLVPPNVYSLTAFTPRAMVVRHSRRDREVLQVPD